MRGWRVGQECGQRWYRPSSWRATWAGVRRFKHGKGFAIGPIMFYKKGM